MSVQAEVKKKKAEPVFVNVTMPLSLDKYTERVVEAKHPDYFFQFKSQLWTAAIGTFLKNRPWETQGLKFKKTKATFSVAGSTGFVQRRIQITLELERDVRALSMTVSDDDGGAVAVSRIIYTAIDYYCRWVASPDKILAGMK